MESFLDSSFRFVDKETDIGQEISKLMSEQEKTPNYDEVDEEIARLIQSFEEEEKQRKEQDKPSWVSCASPLMSFLLEESEEENISVSTDTISQALKGDNLEANNLQVDTDKPPTDKPQSPELELESG